MITRESTTRKPVVRSAFTLMEMLVVVSIIVMLAGLGGVYFLGQQRHSQKKVAEIQIRTLVQACEQFAVNNSTFPDSLEQLLDPAFPGGPYLKTRDAIFVPWSTANEPIQYSYQQSDGNLPHPYIWTTHYGEPVGHVPN